MNNLLPQQAYNLLQKAGIHLIAVSPLRGDGSCRRFLRLSTNQGPFILILPQDGEEGLKEAYSYVHIGLFLAQKGLTVPKIWAYDLSSGLVLVEDLGDLHLEDLSPGPRRLVYPKVIEWLVTFQALAEQFDPRYCLQTTHYDFKIMWEHEALYFLNSFGRDYRGLVVSPALYEELKNFCQEALGKFTDLVLLHRDFQSRNIMVRQGKPYIIDFQGARLGPPSYDLASLLIDPYVGLSPKEIQQYLELYLLYTKRDKAFVEEFYHLALMRNLQILGAFARLSLMGKSWFERYIPKALDRLRYLVQRHFTYLKNLRTFLTQLC